MRLNRDLYETVKLNYEMLNIKALKYTGIEMVYFVDQICFEIDKI